MNRAATFLTGALVAVAVGLSPSVAEAYNYNIHVGGMCSQHFNDGKGGAGIGSWAGEGSVNAGQDHGGLSQTTSISAAAAQLKTNYLDYYCTGTNWCYIYNYSGGDAVLGYLFANYGNIWNIGYTITSGGAGGGSPLAGDIAGTLACAMANQLTETYARGAYNHNDTNGTTVYRLGGYKGLFEAGAACAAGSVLNFLTLGKVSPHCLSGDNDGAVEYASAGGYNDTGDKTDFWNSSGTHWTGHASYFTPSTGEEGDNLNHYEMKRYGVCLDGGISGQSGWSACVNWANAQH